MAVNVDVLCDDLEAETAMLESLVEPLGDDGWNLPTPADGWSVRDQISHLAFFDEAATACLVTPELFRLHRDAVRRDVDAFTDEVARRFRETSGEQVLAWFRGARCALLRGYRDTDPSTRVPWYGPEMSAASAVTARVMETWAHGRDVADALGEEPAATPALRHVADLGVRTLPNSFVTRGRAVPETRVRVELTGPAGEAWWWGPADRAELVRGPARDFCLVVTQRRHLADTDLAVSGPTATEWMSIAQAFAGPPGPGRPPKRGPVVP